MTYIKKSLKMLDAVTSTGAGTTIMSLPQIPDTVTAVVDFTDVGGSISALTVDIEGSVDGINFSSIINTTGGHAFTAAEITDTVATFKHVSPGVSIFRLNVTTKTDSGTGTITANMVAQ